jgi:hypothetical protein
MLQQNYYSRQPLGEMANEIFYALQIITSSVQKNSVGIGSFLQGVFHRNLPLKVYREDFRPGDNTRLLADQPNT